MSENQFCVGQIVEWQGRERVVHLIMANGVFFQGSNDFAPFGELRPAVPRQGDTVRVLAVAPFDTSSTHRVGQECVVRVIHDGSGVHVDSGYRILQAYDDDGGLGTYCKVALLRRAPSVSDGDRLFDEGCCFCGKNRCGVDMHMRVDGPHFGILFGNDCWVALGSPLSEQFDAEVTRRKSLQPKASPDEKWEPKAGDRVTGRLYGLENEELTGRFERISRQGNAEVISDDGLGWYLLLDSLRPAASAPQAKPSPKPDPYAEHRKKEECGELTPNPRHNTRLLDSDIREPDALDRLAATRRKHEQTLSDLDRPVVRGRHDWPSEDAEELYVSF